VDEDGTVVRLMGVNLGAWLYVETWITLMDYDLKGRAWQVVADAGHEQLATDAYLAADASQGDWLEAFAAKLADTLGQETADALVGQIQALQPYASDDSDKPLFDLLEQRFGVEGRDALLSDFLDAWVTEQDIAWIAQQGFNVVRVPMGFRMLIAGSHLDAIDAVSPNPVAFDAIARLLDWCRKYRVWAVLDLQESPGGHNGYSGEPTLYVDPAMQQLTVDLWLEISRTFRQHDAVAALSLLAEPMGAPGPAERDAVYDMLVTALRADGDDRLLVIHDGFFGMATLPDPKDMGWDQVVYSTHLFEWKALSLAAWELLVKGVYPELVAKPQEAHDVPYYIGSFSTRVDAPWSYDATSMLVSWLRDEGWSWSVWTLKRIDDPVDFVVAGSTSAYGVWTWSGPKLDRPDLHLDDFDTLSDKFSGYASFPFAPNTKLVDALVSGL
jgi:hypothetical protein